MLCDNQTSARVTSSSSITPSLASKQRNVTMYTCVDQVSALGKEK
jgi:hypothetical protein